LQYKEFFEQYKQAHFDWTFGRIKTAVAAGEIARLRTLVAALDQPEDRVEALDQLADFEAEISPEAQNRMARPMDAIRQAMDDSGTADERIARAEHGIAAVTRIAYESQDRSEQHQILEMNEMLAQEMALLGDPRFRRG
jgi:hypothetical protein